MGCGPEKRRRTSHSRESKLTEKTYLIVREQVLCVSFVLSVFCAFCVLCDVAFCVCVYV